MSNQNKKSDGLFGIRTAVWVFAFGLVLGCILGVRLLHTNTPVLELTAEEIHEPRAVAHSGRNVRTTVQVELRAKAYEDQVENNIGEIDLSMVEQVTQDRRTWMDGVRAP
jgi:hypothetical protein